jgi:ATP-binding cassette subfamily F protein uup
MNYLTVENLTKSYGEKLLFENISFGIDKGQKVALIARNGTGKTTLLNIIAGLESPDSGKVICRNDIVLNYLNQNPGFDEEQKVIDTLLDSGNKAIQAVKTYEAILENIHHKGETIESTKKLNDIMLEIDRLNAWDIEAKIKEVLSKLKISDLNQKVNELSGGQRKRLALAKVLLESSDLLILDEPTNHLDIEMIEWLEEFLSKQNLSIILVTHDRYFLDNVCDEIMEMDDGSMMKYKGKYAYYLEKKEEVMNSQKIEKERTENLYRKELEWMQRMPQARTTKSKARIGSFYDLHDKVQNRNNDNDFKLQTGETRIGGKVLEMNNVSKNYGDFIAVNDFTYTFKKGERVGVFGKNGIGKTTLINIISGLVRPDNGRVVVGQTIVFGYFSQEGFKLLEEKRVIDSVKEITELIRMGKKEMSAAQFLYRFGFSYNTQHNYISNLSGGEKRRLQLLLVLIKNPNFLILDEPTNDLDIQTLRALEEFLEDFKGCLLIISHDRYFLDNLTDHLFVFEGNGIIKDFPGNYTDYSIYKKKLIEKERKIAKSKPAEIVVSKNTKSSKKLSYNETKELAVIEEEIESLETEMKEMLLKLNNGTANALELNKISLRYGEVEKDLNAKNNRWIELCEKRDLST